MYQGATTGVASGSGRGAPTGSGLPDAVVNASAKTPLAYVVDGGEYATCALSPSMASTVVAVEPLAATRMTWIMPIDGKATMASLAVAARPNGMRALTLP